MMTSTRMVLGLRIMLSTVMATAGEVRPDPGRPDSVYVEFSERHEI